MTPGTQAADADEVQVGWVGEIFDPAVGNRRYQVGKCATAVTFAMALVAMNYSGGKPLGTFQYTATSAANIMGVTNSSLTGITASYATLVTIEGDGVPVTCVNASTIAVGDYVKPSSVAGKVISSAGTVAAVSAWPVWRCVRSAVSNACYIALRKLV